MLLSPDEAREIAERELSRSEIPDLVIHPDVPPVVRHWAVVFCYQTQRALDGDVGALLAGNGPLVVDRRDGTVRRLPTHAPLEVTLPELERRLGLGPT